MKRTDDMDPNSPQRIEREWRFLRNSKVRTQSYRQIKDSRMYYTFFVILRFYYMPPFVFFYPFLDSHQFSTISPETKIGIFFKKVTLNLYFIALSWTSIYVEISLQF